MFLKHAAWPLACFTQPKYITTPFSKMRPTELRSAGMLLLVKISTFGKLVVHISMELAENMLEIKEP